MQKLMQRKFSRDYELEADEEAVRMMVRAGFNPAAVIPYLEKLSDIEELAPLSSYHPSRSRRIETIKKAIAGLQSTEFPSKIEGFAEAKALASALQ